MMRNNREYGKNTQDDLCKTTSPDGAKTFGEIPFPPVTMLLVVAAVIDIAPLRGGAAPFGAVYRRLQMENAPVCAAGKLDAEISHSTATAAHR